MISPDTNVKEQNPNEKSLFFSTQLHFTCATAHPELMKFFTDKGVDLNFELYGELTPLHLAAIHHEHHKEIIQILIKDGVDINIQDQEGYTVLHSVVVIFYLRRFRRRRPQSLDVSIVECLLKYGADPNIPNKLQETPLMSSVKYGAFEFVKKLLHFGANVHLRNENLDTCLHVASGSNRQSNDIIEELIKHGACFFCFNSQGETSLQHILRSDNPYNLRDAFRLIKIAALADWDKVVKYLVNENFWHLSERLFGYCCECGTEIYRMKNIVYSENFTLFHFVLRGYDARLCSLTEESLLSKVLVSLRHRTFRFYHGPIRRNFSISYLQKRLSTHFFVRNEESRKNVFLNEDIFRELSLHLPYKDLFNLAIAYSSPPPSKENEKKL